MLGKVELRLIEKVETEESVARLSTEIDTKTIISRKEGHHEIALKPMKEIFQCFQISKSMHTYILIFIIDSFFS